MERNPSRGYPLETPCQTDGIGRTGMGRGGEVGDGIGYHFDLYGNWQYDNPIPSRFLAPHSCSKIPSRVGIISRECLCCTATSQHFSKTESCFRTFKQPVSIQYSLIPRFPTLVSMSPENKVKSNFKKLTNKISETSQTKIWRTEFRLKPLKKLVTL
jgi:hypothetical protein